MHKPLGDLDRLKAALERDWGFSDIIVDHPVLPEIRACFAGATGRSQWRSTRIWRPRGRR